MKSRPLPSNPADRLADWSNYQTWLVACDLFEHEQKCEGWQVLAWYESQKAAASSSNHAEDCRVAQMQVIEAIAEQLMENYQKMARTLAQPLFSELICDSLDHVAWKEIATGLVLSLICDMTPKVPKWQKWFSRIFGPKKRS